MDTRYFNRERLGLRAGSARRTEVENLAVVTPEVSEVTEARMILRRCTSSSFAAMRGRPR